MAKSRAAKWWSAAVLVAWLPQASAQIDLYVAPAGADGTNTCQDALHPCASVAHALGQATPGGDTIHLAAGTYTEPQLVLDPTYHQGVVLAGAGAQATVIQAAPAMDLATNRVLWIKVNATCEVRDVTLRYGSGGNGGSGVGAGGDGGNGGGILVNGFLTLTRSRVTGNRSGHGGAGAAGFSGGRAGAGGGVYNDGTLRMEDCSVDANATGDGGPAGSGPAVTGGAGGHGSGLCNAGGVMAMTSCTLAFNTNGAGGSGATGGAGGGGAAWNAGLWTVFSSTISDNAAGAGGPGSSGAGGAGGHGGGIWNTSLGYTVLSNTTVAGNIAAPGGGGSPAGSDGGGGGIFNEGGAVSVGHSIVATNRVVAGGVGPDVAGVVDSRGYVLIQASAGATVTGEWTGVQLDVDARVLPLQAAGGPTLTRPLAFTSPAVNAGDPDFTGPPLVDQRGLPRVAAGIVDLGACEMSNTVLFVAQGGADGTNECRDAGYACASLAHAVAVALPGDRIQLATGIYATVGVLLDRDVDVVGQGATATILEAAAAPGLASNRILELNAGVTGRLQGLTLRYGLAPGGASGAPGADGGAILNHGTLYVSDSSVVSNSAGQGGPGDADPWNGGVGGRGGAVYSDGNLWMSNVLVSGNHAGDGGAAGTGGLGGEGGAGGAVLNDGGLEAVDCRFLDNAAGTGGEGDSTGNGGKGGDGGAVYSTDAVFLDRCEVASNRAGAGGAGADGGAGGLGGGVYNEGVGTVESSTLADNEGGDGGDALSDTGGDGGAGGGMYSLDAVVMLSSTVSGNRGGDAGAGGSAAAGHGGGVWAGGGGLVMSNCTVAGNAAGQPDGVGGGLYNASSTISLRHALVGDNAAPGSAPDVAGDATSLGYNLVEDTSGATLAGDTTGNVYGSDPQLGPLQANGGPTRTHALLPGSPARDAGDPSFAPPPQRDQRGLARLQGGRIDLGAVEEDYPDDDGDGLPDGWEIAYGLDPFDNGATNPTQGAVGDVDQDGMDNISEYVAGTHPADSSSWFRASSIFRTTSVAVRYQSVTGRLYTLQCADAVPAPAWSNTSGQVDQPGSGALDSLSDSNAVERRLYRLGVRLP